MADKKEDAVALSDADLDELVQTAEDDTTDDPPEDTTERTAPDAPAPDKAQTETAAPDAAGEPADDDEDDEDEPETAGAPPAEGVTADAAPVIPGAKPFQFKASGAERVLPGAFELPDGSVAIPKAEVGRFRSTLASAVEIQGQFQRYQRDTRRQLEELKAERNEKDVAADLVAGLFAELEGKSEDELWEWVRSFVADAPKIRQDIRDHQLTLREQQLDRRAKGPEPTPEEVQERRTQVLTTELTATYERVATVPQVKKYLTKDELDRIFQKHSKRLDRLVTKADADDPTLGVKKGQEIFDDTEVLEDIEIAINLKKRMGGQAPAARNAALNADRTRGNNGNVIPPAPRRGTAGATAAAAGADKPWSKKDFMAGKLDDDTVE